MKESRSTLLAATTLLAIASCADERVGPATETFTVYAAIRGGSQAWIGVIDPETDSLVDSIHYPGIGSTVFVSVSADGKYVAGIPPGAFPRIWNASTLLPIVDLPNIGEEPIFVEHNSRIVTWDYKKVRRYSFPSTELETTLDEDIAFLREFRPHGTLIGINQRGPTSSPRDLSEIVVLDYLKMEVTDSFIINPDESGKGFQIFDYDLSPDGSRLYALGTLGGGGPSVLCFDLNSRQVVFRRGLTLPNGACRVSPGGSELWYTDPGYDSRDLIRPPGVIVVLDALSGATKDTIHTIGFYNDTSKSLFPRDIRFVPSTEDVLIGCGSFWRGAQPMLVIDGKSRTIRTTIFSEFHHLVDDLELAPGP